MNRVISAIVICLALVGCSPEITDFNSFASPDSKKVIAVVEELQGANDPAPWWTHVSIRDKDDDLLKIPGNILKLEGRGEVEAIWKSNSEIVIYIEDSLYDAQSLDSSTTLNGLRISVVRLSAKTEPKKSEQVAAP